MKVLRVGDRVVFDGASHQVVALDGVRVRIVGDRGAQVVLLSHLVGCPDFELLDHAPEAPGGVLADTLEDLPPAIAARARLWERHLIEVETGRPPHRGSWSIGASAMVHSAT